ncbi:MAG: hypothetical protein ACI93T_002251, partial [Porticoccaceae bacterium]
MRWWSKKRKGLDPKTETLSTLSVSFRQRVPDQFSTSADQTGWKAC